MKQDNRTLAELEKAYLSDESAAEFDRIVRRSESRRRRPAVWGLMLAAAASLALIVILRPRQCDFNGLEIAEGIQQIMSLDTDNVKFVTATPDGGRIILTAEMNDGSRCSYVMNREGGAVSITAMK